MVGKAASNAGSGTYDEVLMNGAAIPMGCGRFADIDADGCP